MGRGDLYRQAQYRMVNLFNRNVLSRVWCPSGSLLYQKTWIGNIEIYLHLILRLVQICQENGGCNFFEWCDTPSSGRPTSGRASIEVC